MLPRLIVGLGNPKSSYDETRHNIGRRYVEQSGRGVTLPCYMNESGPALQNIMRQKGLTPADILIIVDDFMIPFGTLRLRPKGSSGGHNGLKSVIETLGTEEFARLRVGIGPVPDGQDPAEFVLKPFTKTEEKEMSAVFEKISQGLDLLAREDYQKAMNEINQ